MSPDLLLTIYCVLVLLASLAGGWLLLAIHLTHTRLQVAISFVAGLMLGIALLHFLPDACGRPAIRWFKNLGRAGCTPALFDDVFRPAFFHFHHHDLPEGDPEDCCSR